MSTLALILASSLLAISPLHRPARTVEAKTDAQTRAPTRFEPLSASAWATTRQRLDAYAGIAASPVEGPLTGSRGTANFLVGLPNVEGAGNAMHDGVTAASGGALEKQLRFGLGYALTAAGPYAGHGLTANVAFHILAPVGPVKLGGGPKLNYRNLLFPGGGVHFIGFGGDFLVGGGSKKIFGYGIVTLLIGPAIASIRVDGATASAAGLGGQLMFGGGLYGMVASRVSLGGQAQVGMFGGTGGVAFAMDLLFTVGVHF